jgi:ubiquitin-protein ligase
MEKSIMEKRMESERRIVKKFKNHHVLLENVKDKIDEFYFIHSSKNKLFYGTIHLPPRYPMESPVFTIINKHYKEQELQNNIKCEYTPALLLEQYIESVFWCWEDKIIHSTVIEPWANIFKDFIQIFEKIN